MAAAARYCPLWKAACTEQECAWWAEERGNCRMAAHGLRLAGKLGDLLGTYDLEIAVERVRKMKSTLETIAMAEPGLGPDDLDCFTCEEHISLAHEALSWD